MKSDIARHDPITFIETKIPLSEMNGKTLEDISIVVLLTENNVEVER